jgi:hypothetical protein
MVVDVAGILAADWTVFVVIVVVDVVEAANGIGGAVVAREMGCCSCNVTCTGTGASSRVDVATVRVVVAALDATAAVDDAAALGLVGDNGKPTKWP